MPNFRTKKTIEKLCIPQYDSSTSINILPRGQCCLHGKNPKMDVESKLHEHTACWLFLCSKVYNFLCGPCIKLEWFWMKVWTESICKVFDLTIRRLQGQKTLIAFPSPLFTQKEIVRNKILGLYCIVRSWHLFFVQSYPIKFTSKQGSRFILVKLDLYCVIYTTHFCLIYC